MKIEVECSTIEMGRIAIEAGADVIVSLVRLIIVDAGQFRRIWHSHSCLGVERGIQAHVRPISH
jgi:hypothetical protein